MKGNKGFSFIEMMITIGIITIITVAISISSNYIKYANTKRCVNEMNSMLEKVRILSMSKSKQPFLYIYFYNGYYYMKSTTEALTKDDQGTFLGNDSIKITAIDEANVLIPVNNVNTLKLGFLKSNGGCDAINATYYKSITVSGESGEYTIKLVKLTGKHFIK